MLALVAGYILVAYLLAPGAIYRLVFSLFIPSKRFQRDRTEEIVFSVLAVIVPFTLCWIVLCHTPVGRLPHFVAAPGKTEAYRQVIQGLISDGHMPPSIFDAYRRVLREQARFVICLWLLCGFEGWLAGKIVAGYGNYPDTSRRKRICDKFLLRHVSEWQVLFTTMTLAKAEQDRSVEVDVLSADTLYRGTLVNWFTEKDGNLAGIFLGDACRFRREDYIREKAKGGIVKREHYWTKIPGSKLYIAASSITNYNIRYAVNPLERLLRERFGEDVTIVRLGWWQRQWQRFGRVARA